MPGLRRDPRPHNAASDKSGAGIGRTSPTRRLSYPPRERFLSAGRAEPSEGHLLLQENLNTGGTATMLCAPELAEDARKPMVPKAR
jgi:hypothetical protein